MRALSESRTRIDCLVGQQEVAEVAKFAAKFGYKLNLAPSEENGFWEAGLARIGEVFLRDDLEQLIYLVAMTDNESVDNVMARAKDRLQNHHHVQLNIPPADQAGIGELHPEGH